MIGYITLGTNDFERAAGFYDGLFAEVGAGRGMEDDRFIAWVTSPSAPAISIIKPFDGEPATVGNGSMCAITVDSREKVDRLHAKALELGGTCEGEPGPRGDSGMYFAYFRDLDGNKLAAYTMSPS